MSLRRRLFLLLGGLVCLLVVGQWLLFRSLTRAVADDVRTVAFRVGEDILSGFSYRTETLPRSPAPGAVSSGTPAEAPSGAQGRDLETHVVIVTSDSDGSAAGEAHAEGGGAAWTEAIEPSPRDESPRLVMRRELHWKGTEGETGTSATATGGASGEGLRKIVLETDAARDVLFVRGPAMKRRIPIPDAEVSSTLDRYGSQLLLGNLALLAAGLLAAAVMAHRLTRPLAGLTAAAERVGEGELGVAVDLQGAGDTARGDEVGRAIGAFNRMSHRLAELDRENRRLASAEHLSELGEVARGLAHSLRNPLNALGLAIEQVGAPAEVVEGSRRQIRRMDGALRSFLALASAGAAQGEAVDLAQLAREVALEALQDGAGRVGIDVEAAPGDPAVLSVNGVPAELKAVLQALVVNAVEASPAGSRVAIRLAAGAPASVGASGGVRIEVEDQGAGLPEEVRARLFEPHVTTKAHGSGMGLFLAHRLVSGRYAGALRLEPRSGAASGTTAILDLGDRVR